MFETHHVIRWFTYTIVAESGFASVALSTVPSLCASQNMFENAKAFNQPLDSFDIGSVNTMDDMFRDTALDDCNRVAIRDRFSASNPSVWDSNIWDSSSDWSSAMCKLPPPSLPPSPPPPGVPLQVAANGSFSAALLSSPARQGLPLHINVAGTHHVAPIVVDANSTASEVWLEGDGSSAELNAIGTLLLSVQQGAPPIHIIGFILRGHIHINSSSLVELRNCSLVSQGPSSGRRAMLVSDGTVELRAMLMSSLAAGALEVAGGFVTIWDSSMTNNTAARGGAVLLRGGGVLTMYRSLLDDNSALESGGAIAVDGGSLLLANQTALRRNAAPQGRTLFLLSVSASVSYGLPVPLGHWIAEAFLCKEYRVPCAASAPNCIEAEQPVLAEQPCDYATNPQMIGLTMSTVEVGALDDDYPLPCPASSYGDSFDVRLQSRPSCSGVCPPRAFCPMATLAPLDCIRGSYCPYGSAAPTNCPGGTYSNAINLASVTECIICANGTYCPLGSAEATPCSAGRFNNESGQETCRRCENGQYQNGTGAESCKDCVPGHWCSSEGQYPCPVDTYSPASRAMYNTVCKRCPDRTTTHGVTGATSNDTCVCQKGFYSADASATQQEGPICKACTSGTNCTDPGLQLEHLPLLPGYFRASTRSDDVRKCPGVNSGCLGGGDADQCADGLTGVFCSLCINSTGRYYAAGTSTSRAMCKECPPDGATASLLAVALTVGASLLAASRLLLHRSPELQNAVHRAGVSLRELAVPSKIKQVVSFYQLATPVQTVYGVVLPEEARRMFDAFKIGVSFGVADVPLECIGLRGYEARLVFWMVLPLAILLAIPLTRVCVRLVGPSLRRMGKQPAEQQQNKETTPSLLTELGYECLPSCLKVLFLTYPLVSTIAFRAFDCLDLGVSGRFLRADYSVQCDAGAEYTHVQALAVLAVFLFPVGVPAAYAALLFHSRRALRAETPTQLSRALAFLHEDFRSAYYMWELVEVLRRFLLVGVACVIRPGTLTQLFLGTTVALVFLVLQMQARPFKRSAEGFLSMATGFALILILLCCILLQVGTLNDQSDLTNDGVVSLTEQLTPEMKARFSYSIVLLSTGLIASLLAALVVAFAILVAQRAEERKHAQQLAALKRMRRLRFVNTKAPVTLPDLKEGHFHLFLSHCWKGGGQDTVRVIKQRLKEMIPEIRAFLDVVCRPPNETYP